MITIREERMAEFFTKFHVEGLKVPAVFHEFTAADGGDPHSHPFGFTSFIVSGGYVEEIYLTEGVTTGLLQTIHRKAGDSFRIGVDHIHRIVALPTGHCETLILPGPWVQKSGFYQFREDGVWHRFWDEPDFTPYPRDIAP